MPDLLLELLSEEIPARMQAKAAKDLERLVNERLLAAGFLPESVKAFAGPRRLALIASGLPVRQADRVEEKKGPRVGAPEKAIDGFLKSAGLSSLDQCAVVADKKGDYYVARIAREGSETSNIIAEMIPAVVREFPWPKSMRWGEGDLSWVRPLSSILCCFNGEIVPFVVDGVASGDETRGHRRATSAPIRARSFETYVAALTGAKVMLDGKARADLIAADAKTLCEAQGLELVEDKGLLAEVAGLAEWPVVMIGSFDAKFLALPEEVLTASMRGHQKYFSVRDPETGRLANKFVYVANIEAADGGAAMRAGYERVLAARLSDAWYLYHQDLKAPLEERVKDLDRVTFFEGLGTVGDKARRIAALAKEIAPAVGADPELAEKAALLAKADLTTGMVGEFPELQGVMGRYYWLVQHGGAAEEAPSGSLRSPPPPQAGEESARGARAASPPPRSGGGVRSEATDGGSSSVHRQIADAIRDHYKPQGADHDAPTAPVAVAVALADRIDTLTAFWAIGKKPTGSGDPFALRRAALGWITIIVENALRLRTYGYVARSQAFRNEVTERVQEALRGRGIALTVDPRELLEFFHDRLKVYLRDRGHRFDHIDAVLAKADGSLEDDLVLIIRKLEALESFLKTDDGANLAAAYKRARNILKAEGVGRVQPAGAGATGEEADFIRPTVDEKLLRQAEEKALFAALKFAEEKASRAVAEERFADTMAALSTLRAPIDSFFDKVTVNDADAKLRANRLALLLRFIAATATAADLSKLEG